MSKLAAALRTGRSVVTSELTPPKGTDLDPLFAKAQRLRDVIDAFNLTDSHASRMAMAPGAVAHLLIDRGIEPIVQMTARDRNRIALQADLLGAYALGVRNFVFMGGDPPSNGDHPDAKPVFDLSAASLAAAATSLNRGADMMDNALSGAPALYIGAVVNPGADDLNNELRRMDEKREAGAQFFQTQAVYEPAAYERFVRKTDGLDVRLLTGIMPLKSQRMAEYMNEKVPGVNIPQALIKEIADAEDRKSASVEMAARIIREVRPMAQGLHIMAIGWEDLIPEILAASNA